VALSLGLVAVVVAAVAIRPRGLGVGTIALVGAGVALAARLVTLHDLVVVLGIVWNPTLTFVGIVALSILLDEAGVFAALARVVFRASRGRPLRLLVAVLLADALVAGVVANDGAALILTPIVLAGLLEAGIRPRDAFWLVMAVGFVADTASLPLEISNLVNLIGAEGIGASFGRYAVVMVPVDLVSVAASIGVVALWSRRHLPRSLAVPVQADPRAALTDRRVAAWAGVVVPLLLVAYLVQGALRIPISALTGAALAVLLAVAGLEGWPPRRRSGGVSVLEPLRRAPWQVVLFSVGMYVVIESLVHTRVLRVLEGGVVVLAHLPQVLGVLVAGSVAAVGASVVNNLPAIFIARLAIAGAPIGHGAVRALAYAAIVGCDLGPKLTPIGSLATLLWLHVLAQRGVEVGWGRYVRAGVVLTLPVLAVVLAALAGTLALGL